MLEGFKAGVVLTVLLLLEAWDIQNGALWWYIQKQTYWR